MYLNYAKIYSLKNDEKHKYKNYNKFTYKLFSSFSLDFMGFFSLSHVYVDNIHHNSQCSIVKTPFCWGKNPPYKFQTVKHSEDFGGSYQEMIHSIKREKADK